MVPRATGPPRAAIDGKRGTRAEQASAAEDEGHDFSNEVKFLKAKKMSAVQAKRKVDELRLRYNKELMDILEQEQERENEREQQIQTLSNPQEAEALEKEFGIERARASQRIIEASEKHERMIQEYLRKVV